MATRDLPTIEYLRQRLRYEPETGKLYWRPFAAATSQWNGKWAGREAGTRRPDGYRKVFVDGHQISAHRVIWAMHHGCWPSGEIDHINHERDNNRLENLRDVSRTENRRNHSRNRNNTSGVTGVAYYAKEGNWLAQMQVGYRNVLFRRFATFEEAVAARKAAEARYGFHANHGVNTPKAEN